jgi:transcriptional regulator with XRE-family HTH domain
MSLKRINKLYLLGARVKGLRENMGLTQNALAKKLGLTRSSVNGWEMGAVIPATKIIVELSNFFNVSADYLLGLDGQSVLKIDGLSDKEILSLLSVIECYKTKKEV